jgi:hypothetical protein
MVTVSSSILSPRDDTEGAFSQCTELFGEIPISLTLDTGSVAFYKRELKTADIWGSSQAL